MFIASVVAVSFFCALLITPLVARYAANRRLYDLPGGRRVHTRPVPRLGGVAIFIALLASMAVVLPRILENHNGLGDEANFFVGTLLGGVIIFAAGLRDDLKALPPVVKLLFQIVAALVVYAFGVRIEVLALGPVTTVDTGWLALPLTVCWIVGVTNAINLIDGLDGLATGIALVALAATMAVAGVMGRIEGVIMSAALTGALAGFLLYNFNPARIFLGDSGSYLIGFMLSVLAIQGSFKSGTATLVVVPALALGLPILDVALAIARRWLRGVPIFGADAGHIHHRLLALGLTHRRAVFVMYAIASILAMVGMLLVFTPPAAVLGISLGGGLLVLALVGYGIRRLDYHEFQVAGSAVTRGALRARHQIRFRIQARELVRAIESSGGVRQVNSLLEQNAARLGVMDIAFGPRGSLDQTVSNQQSDAVKIEIPISINDREVDYILWIWCDRNSDRKSNSGEALGLLLVPALERMLERMAGGTRRILQDNNLADWRQKITEEIHTASRIVAGR